MDEVTRYDIDGFDKVTRALLELVNGYPKLDYGETFSFGIVDSESGIAFIPSSGASITREIEDITGHVTQDCVYPFTILYKASGLSENRKIDIKEWLDDLGRWLGKQPISYQGQEYKITEYPALTRERKIVNIQSTSPSFLNEVTESNVETWLLTMQATYKNEFDR